MRRLALERLESKQMLSTIVLDPSTTYQTMGHAVGPANEHSGVWEATAWAGDSTQPAFNNYIDQLLDLAVNELGIDRVRLEVRSGSENNQDYWSEWQAAGAPSPPDADYYVWRHHRYSTVNDDDDPMHINWSGFHFSELDHTIETIVLPLQQKLGEIGKRLYVNLNYVSFNGQIPDASLDYHHSRDAQEYAEFVLATYQHMDEQFGFVPDSWEVILEPENTSTGNPGNSWPKWSASYIAGAIAAAGTRLEDNGYTPRFVAPSNVNAGNTASWTNTIAQNPQALDYLHEVSYHLYGGNNNTNRRAIANVAAQHGLSTAQLEKLGASHHDLHNDLKYANNSSWAFYTFRDYLDVDESDPDRPVISISNPAKLMQQYMKYVGAGFVRIGATTDDGRFDPLAFVADDGGYVVVVKASQGGDISVEGLPPGSYGITYATSNAQDVALPEITVEASAQLNTSIPRSGVLTIRTSSGGDVVDVEDINALFAAIRAGNSADEFDYDGDGDVDQGDVEFLVENALGTFMGDANLDGKVDATDLNQVGIHWQTAGVAGWQDGDFTGEGSVNAADLNIVGLNWQRDAAATAPQANPHQRVPRAPLRAAERTAPIRSINVILDIGNGHLVTDLRFQEQNVRLTSNAPDVGSTTYDRQRVVDRLPEWQATQMTECSWRRSIETRCERSQQILDESGLLGQSFDKLFRDL